MADDTASGADGAIFGAGEAVVAAMFTLDNPQRLMEYYRQSAQEGGGERGFEMENGRFPLPICNRSMTERVQQGTNQGFS